MGQRTLGIYFFCPDGACLGCDFILGKENGGWNLVEVNTTSTKHSKKRWHTGERTPCSHWMPTSSWLEGFLLSVSRGGFLSAVPHFRAGCFSRSMKYLQLMGAGKILQGQEHEVTS